MVKIARESYIENSFESSFNNELIKESTLQQIQDF